MSVTDWSPQPSGNAMADRAIPARDGMAGRELPEAIRGLMAKAAALALDQGGALFSSGIDNVYRVSTYSGFAEVKPGVSITFTAHATNTAEPFLNVDGTGPRPWVNSDGDDFSIGAVQENQIYTVFWAEPSDGLPGAWRTSGAPPASVRFAPELANTFSRTLDEKAREQSVSFLDYFPRSIANGILSGTVIEVDLTEYLQRALDSGRDLFMPANLPRLTRMRVTKALRQTKANQRIYWALAAQLVYDRPRGPRAPNGQPGTAIEPVWVIMQSAVGAEIWHLNVDHQGTLYGNPTIGGGNLGLGSAVLIMANQAYAHRCVVQNAWDNGIAVADFGSLGDTVEQNNGRPRGVVIYGSRTLNCGRGPHDDGNADSVGHQAGGGVNNLTGSATIISDCVDVGSSTNFIQDFKAGCDGHWSGCTGTAAYRGPIGYLGNPAGGIGMYFAGNGTVIGLKIDDCAGPGLIVDGTASNATFVHVRVKSAAEEGFKVGGTNITLVSPRAENCSYNKPGAFPAILLYGTGDAGGGTYGPANNINLYDPQTSGPFHRRGIELKREQGGIPGRCVGGTLNGTIEAYGPLAERLTMPEFVFEGVRTAGQLALRSTGQRSLDNTNTNAVTFPFGTSRDGVPGGTPNGTWFLRDENDPRKQLILGFDPDRLMGVLQTILEGDRFLPLSLNPGGGDIEMNSVRSRVFGTDSEAAAAGLRVGCMYIDRATGFLRIRLS